MLKMMMFCFPWVLASVAAQSVTGLTPTNSVAVRGDVFLAVTDDFGVPNIDWPKTLRDESVEATNRLYYILQHRGTNVSHVVLIRRGEFPFEFSLMDSNGTKV